MVHEPLDAQLFDAEPFDALFERWQSAGGRSWLAPSRGRVTYRDR